MLGMFCEINGMGRIKIPMFILFSIGIFLIHMGFLIGILIRVVHILLSLPLNCFNSL